MNEFKYNIGYALSGGFIKGFAHLGIMQALHEHGIRPEILSGVSAGALAAVFYADGKEPYHIVELFEHHSFKELTTFSINKQGLLKLDSFIDFLNSNLESKTIEELKIPTIITATDLDHGRIVSFKKGKIAERLAASCCMPILFAPIRINNTYYVDGGILMNLPVSPIRKECEKVIALNVDPLVADEYSKNVVSIALRAYPFYFFLFISKLFHSPGVVCPGVPLPYCILFRISLRLFPVLCCCILPVRMIRSANLQSLFEAVYWLGK